MIPMEFDLIGFKIATELGWDYVATLANGKIVGWGMNRTALEEKHPNERIYSLNEYEKATKGVKRKQRWK